MKKRPADPTPEPDWNLHITAMVSPRIREAIVTLMQAAQADHDELENLKRAAALLVGRGKKKST
jgi:hypothetical protein